MENVIYSDMKNLVDNFINSFCEKTNSIITNYYVANKYKETKEWTSIMKYCILGCILKDMADYLKIPIIIQTEKPFNNKYVDIVLNDKSGKKIIIPIEHENDSKDDWKRAIHEEEIPKLFDIHIENNSKMMVFISYDHNEEKRLKNQKLWDKRKKLRDDIDKKFDKMGGFNSPFLLILGNTPIDMDNLYKPENEQYRFVNWSFFVKYPSKSEWDCKENYCKSPK